ncbi:MAG: peroxiredoxin [Kofleriaceae bacterium]
MPSTDNPDLHNVDWSKLPVPIDDGAARHLEGSPLPDLALAATQGRPINLARLAGRSVVFVYPRTGEPGVPALVDDWDQIPGARGCTPQACAFRDLHDELRTAGVDHVFGLSTQDTGYQREVADRLHLPFPILSDDQLALTDAIGLPTFEVAGTRLLKRLALIIDGGRIAKVFYPVFPPDRNAAEVLAWLRG